MHELCRLSATELALLIARRAVSSREVVAAHLARIDEVNGHVNAVTVVLRESALAAADAADAAGAGAARGPFHGVPFTVKENIDCLGSATTHGVPALEHSMPSSDAPVVARMKSAGAIVLGRTNLPEFALRLSTDNPLRGSTLNPWNPYLTPGGSSGGDAAALATGMTPFGLGNDLGGSLRNPAYCCGVAALKPTTGRIPRAGSIPPLGWGDRDTTHGGRGSDGPLGGRSAARPVGARRARYPRSSVGRCAPTGSGSFRTASGPGDAHARRRIAARDGHRDPPCRKDPGRRRMGRGAGRAAGTRTRDRDLARPAVDRFLGTDAAHTLRGLEAGVRLRDGAVSRRVARATSRTARSTPHGLASCDSGRASSRSSRW